jgi:uncharacterized zinc-type alcohol dehydrogenase-like protein
MRFVKARAVAGLGEVFTPTTIQRRDPGPTDVAIDIAFAGLCHSDIEHVRSAWGQTIYPLVPGHEMTGIVTEVGSNVTMYEPGDRVGVGCMVDSCGSCEFCHIGEEQFCPDRVKTYNDTGRDGQPTHGGYSQSIVVPEPFVARIPDTLSLSGAAPLLCAGITTYSPLRRNQVGPGTNVAVVGLGGLGHVAVQIAAALGASTTVFDLDPDKRDQSLALGADTFYCADEEGILAQMAARFDLVLNTAPTSIDTDAFLRLLRLDGTMVNIGVPDKPLVIDPFSLIVNRRSIAGTRIGGMAETQEMLAFCGAHGIEAVVEVIHADELDAAYRRIIAGDVRFRFVLDNKTL